jgi:tight adherence protein B
LAAAATELSSAAAVAVVVGTAAVGCAVPLVIWDSLPAGIAGALFGLLLPLAWWKIQAVRRLRALRNLLPPALDLLAQCLSGEQTLERVMEIVAQQTPEPLKAEFGYCVALLAMAQTPASVMERFAQRVPLPEVRLFATAVAVHRQTGGNLATLTARLASAAHDRQEVRRHLSGQTAAARVSSIGLVACGVFGFVVLGASRPQYLDFFVRDPMGIGLLATAAGLLALGGFLIWQILKTGY